MEKRKILHITDVSKLGMYDFSILYLDANEELLLLVGDKGYDYYYRVELKFFDVLYIACATSFMDMGTFQFRYATVEETEAIQTAVGEGVKCVYCFEEESERRLSPPEKPPRRFFIAAGAVEIMLYSGGEHIDDFLKSLNISYETEP